MKKKTCEENWYESLFVSGGTTQRSAASKSNNSSSKNSVTAPKKEAKATEQASNESSEADSHSLTMTIKESEEEFNNREGMVYHGSTTTGEASFPFDMYQLEND